MYNYREVAICYTDYKTREADLSTAKGDRVPLISST